MPLTAGVFAEDTELEAANERVPHYSLLGGR